MDVACLLLELYGRIPPLAQHAVTGVDLDQLTESPSPGTNSIAWLIWHLTRVQDHHVAELLDTDQLWISGGWAGRFGLDPDPSNTGYGHSARQVASIRPERAQVLLDYLDAVDGRTRSMLQALTPADLDRIVDRRWDPPVTLGVRLISIADDSLQHAGQAAYVRGLLSEGEPFV
jgi:DinB superfamily